MSRRDLSIKKRATSVTIPDRVGPHVKLVFAEMRRQNRTYDEVEAGSGVLRATLKAWRRKNRPSLESIEAVLGFLGYDFVPLPRQKVLPKECVAALEAARADMDASMPQAIAALVEIVAGIYGREAPSPSPRKPKGAPVPSARRVRFTPHRDQVGMFPSMDEAA